MARTGQKQAPAAVPAPTEIAVRAATPAVTTVTPPAAMAFFEKYRAGIAPLEAFQVTSNDDFVVAGQAFSRVTGFIDEVTKAFAESKGASHKSWKAICALEGMFVDPAELVKTNLSAQMLGWKRKLDEERQAEERRLQREAEEHARAEREQRMAEERERQRLVILEAQAEKLPWDEEDGEALPVFIEPPPPEPIHVPAVRLPSTVPFVPGGPASRKKPWAGRGTDLKAFILAAAARSLAGDDSMINSGLVAFDAVRLNQLAREHQGALGEVFPGTEGYQDETLARA